ncbi:hypothetical protein A2291_01515 [candidate division WOR-1 bacterium RIFOXYB2_FULL_42_35]|uniref:Uncharacterized protein n=1 Tax=candidate division WOR-1 bacterium RIFOXYC2_FULL_41_25 TaxID=1802586 RepID=A0A1F4TKT2_UNCSA|nr:MAG: hypothetical protein A2247_06205 [candidate division WOR-1 bacterium RIFOXYA2_FULL_41_14]OGC22134.1 MAG: hypothetical protein A2291_01515 [candidate division WOR-1 bacterium RIFOXYB2_FULL_42_35]OGC33321.1 MAG: hypothetical protein A2462_00035 [candidate division WOR-1 bacterium RIFOXYC2_FULL_41_25]
MVVGSFVWDRQTFGSCLYAPITCEVGQLVEGGVVKHSSLMEYEVSSVAQARQETNEMIAAVYRAGRDFSNEVDGRKKGSILATKTFQTYSNYVRGRKVGVCVRYTVAGKQYDIYGFNAGMRNVKAYLMAKRVGEKRQESLMFYLDFFPEEARQQPEQRIMKVAIAYCKPGEEPSFVKPEIVWVKPDADNTHYMDFRAAQIKELIQTGRSKSFDFVARVASDGDVAIHSGLDLRVYVSRSLAGEIVFGRISHDGKCIKVDLWQKTENSQSMIVDSKVLYEKRGHSMCRVVSAQNQIVERGQAYNRSFVDPGVEQVQGPWTLSRRQGNVYAQKTIGAGGGRSPTYQFALDRCLQHLLPDGITALEAQAVLIGRVKGNGGTRLVEFFATESELSFIGAMLVGQFRGSGFSPFRFKIAPLSRHGREGFTDFWRASSILEKLSFFKDLRARNNQGCYADMLKYLDEIGFS